VVDKRITHIHFPSRFSKIIFKQKAFLECTISITVTGSSEQGQADGNVTSLSMHINYCLIEFEENLGYGYSKREPTSTENFNGFSFIQIIT